MNSELGEESPQFSRKKKIWNYMFCHSICCHAHWRLCYNEDVDGFLLTCATSLNAGEMFN